MANSRKSYQYIVLVLKLLIFGAAIAFVYYKVFHGKDTDILKAEINRSFVNSYSVTLLLGALLLMPLNWGIEAKKWQFLIKPIASISFRRALAATFSGATISLFTPNRIGGFLGRVVYLEPAVRGKASFLSVFGNFCQLLVTVLLGTLGLGYAILQDYSFEELTPDLLTGIWLVSIVVTVLMLFMYFRPTAIVKFLFRFVFLHKIAKHARVFKALEPQELWTVFFYSLIRYLVFVVQFILLLEAYGIHLAMMEVVSLIAVVYLILAIVPSIVLGNLGVRESAVILVIGSVVSGNGPLVAASLSIWAINLVLPALIGGVFILGTKLNLFPAKA